MTTPVRKRRAWSAKLTKLAAAAQAAQEAVLVGIYEARQDGVTQQVIADSIKDLSPSGVAAKARKGEAIIKARKGKNQP